MPKNQAIDALVTRMSRVAVTRNGGPRYEITYRIRDAVSGAPSIVERTARTAGDTIGSYGWDSGSIVGRRVMLAFGARGTIDNIRHWVMAGIQRDIQGVDDIVGLASDYGMRVSLTDRAILRGYRSGQRDEHDALVADLHDRALAYLNDVVAEPGWGFGYCDGDCWYWQDKAR